MSPEQRPVLALHGATRQAIFGAIEDVETFAHAARNAPDLDAARSALLAARNAILRASLHINDAEAETRRAALDSIRTFA